MQSAFVTFFALPSKEIHNVIIHPSVPDLRKRKLIAKEAPVLEKAMPAYQLLQRQLTINQLQERADHLSVSYNL